MNEAEESPDYLGQPKRPEGIRVINKRLLGLASGVLVLFLIPVAYTYHDRFNPNLGSGNSEEEPIKVVDVAPSPIKIPEPSAKVVRPVYPAEPVSAPTAVSGLSEEEKKIREKKLAELEAAIKAKPDVYIRDKVEASDNRQMQSIAAMMPPGPMPTRTSYPADSGMEGENGDPHGQAEKRAFLNAHNEQGSPYLKHTRMPPVSEFELTPGFTIPGVMLSGINSDLPGQITGQVRQNVYDSATGRVVLIPAGSKLIGTYDSGISSGQERVLVAWTDVVFPDGSYLRLGAMPGTDKSGVAGMHDQVNNHFLRILGQVALVSLFTSGSQLSQPRGSVQGNYSFSQILAASVGMQGFNLGAQFLRQGFNRQPTLEIRPGMQFNIAVTKRIVLPPWRGHPLATAQAGMAE